MGSGRARRVDTWRRGAGSTRAAGRAELELEWPGRHAGGHVARTRGAAGRQDRQTRGGGGACPEGVGVEQAVRELRQARAVREEREVRGVVLQTASGRSDISGPRKRFPVRF